MGGIYTFTLIQKPFVLPSSDAVLKRRIHASPMPVLSASYEGPTRSRLIHATNLGRLLSFVLQICEQDFDDVSC